MAHPVILLTLLTLCVFCHGQDVRKPPIIQTPDRPKTVYVKEGQDIVEKCEAKADPAATYKWKKNGIDLVPENGVTFDATTGTLTIKKYHFRYHNGDYMCVATNEFDIPGSTALRAASFSDVITMKQIQLDITEAKGQELQGYEYAYKMIPCKYTGTVVGPDMSHSWYRKMNQIQITNYNSRLFVDAKGNLHFTYLLMDDDDGGIPYSCAVGSVKDKFIKQSSGNELKVIKADSTGTAPKLQTSDKVEAKLFSTATLECVFSGYDPNNPDRPPTVSWQDQNRNPIKTNDDKYVISADMRQLTIKNIQESDEGVYRCKGTNGIGETEPEPVELDIFSDPIWDPKNTGAPSDKTVPEGQDFVFSCSTRSMEGEQAPSSPTWYINGVEFGNQHSPNDFEMSGDKKKLTVKSVTKDRSIMCVQCQVSNVKGTRKGTTWGDGCLNVIVPIDITRKPEPEQDIEYGDLIELTVTATTDKSIKNLNKQWHFKNETYDYDKLPFAEIDDVGDMFINTSKLSKEDYKTVAGVYKLEIYHSYEHKSVETEVFLRDKTAPVPVTASAGFPMWIIGLILGILLLLLIIFIIVCVICRKQQEGDYNVDKKEVGAGLNPKQELMEKGFDDFSRPNPNDFEYGDKPRRELPFDEDDPMGDDNKSLGEYSEDEEAQFFNEDGSFIGQYHKKDPNRLPNNNHETVA